MSEMSEEIMGALAPFIVSVKEKLPKIHTPVLATDNGKEWLVAQVFDNTSWKKGEGGYVGWVPSYIEVNDYDHHEFTHWMPLPNKKDFKREILNKD